MENFTSLVEVCFSLSQTHPYLEAAACSLSNSIQADGPARARGRRGKLTPCSSPPLALRHSSSLSGRRKLETVLFPWRTKQQIINWCPQPGFGGGYVSKKTAYVAFKHLNCKRDQTTDACKLNFLLLFSFTCKVKEGGWRAGWTTKGS